MRRAVALVCLFVLGGGLLPATAATVSTDRLAFASWSIPKAKPNHFDWYFIGATDHVHLGEEGGIIAAAGKGSCVRERINERRLRTTCTGRASAMSERPSAFQMDAGAMESLIRIREDGSTHKGRIVSGSPNDDGFYTVEGLCQPGGAWGAGIYRMGEADATLFGRRVTSRGGSDLALMMSGARVEACEGAEDLFTDLANGEEIRLTFVRN